MSATATIVIDTGSVDHAGLSVSFAPMMPASVTMTIDPVAEISWQTISISRLALLTARSDMRGVSHNRQTRAATLRRVKVDLHTHTTASDGSLDPPELVRDAIAEGVELLSITDHDTLAAYEDLAPPTSLRLVTGIELSSQWSGRTIHVVGLNVDRDSAAARSAVEHQQAARSERASRIADRLALRGLDVDLDRVMARANGGSIGRPHFAAELVDSGQVKDLRTAFRKHLGAGKTGDVKTHWPELATVVRWIRDAGGIAVLAHPAKYRMTRTKLRCLAADFVAAGGGAVEIVCGQQQRDVFQRLTELANAFGLAVSFGSDFHSPVPWLKPGVTAEVPAGLEPVWATW